MKDALSGVAPSRRAAYAKHMQRLSRLRGLKLLHELFGASPELIAKEVASGMVKQLPGRQNKQRGTLYRKRQRIAKRSRRRNRATR